MSAAYSVGCDAHLPAGKEKWGDEMKHRVAVAIWDVLAECLHTPRLTRLVFIWWFVNTDASCFAVPGGSRFERAPHTWRVVSRGNPAAELAANTALDALAHRIVYMCPLERLAWVQEMESRHD